MNERQLETRVEKNTTIFFLGLFPRSGPRTAGDTARFRPPSQTPIFMRLPGHAVSASCEQLLTNLKLMSTSRSTKLFTCVPRELEFGNDDTKLENVQFAHPAV